MYKCDIYCKFTVAMIIGTVDRLIIALIAIIIVVVISVILILGVIGINPRYETMVVRTGANIRSCSRITCSVIGGLKIGDKIQSQGQVDGEEVRGNDKWIKFNHNGTEAYVWSGLVSTLTPQPTATKQSATATEQPPTATKRLPATKRPTATETPNMFLYPRSCLYVRDCPRWSSCRRVGRVVESDTIQVFDRVEGEEVNGNDEWIKFKYYGRNGYIPRSYLLQERQPYSIFPTTSPSAFSRSFLCNCSKLCDEMTCAEAFYQYVNCGCERRDSDNDGMPCDARCECRR